MHRPFALRILVMYMRLIFKISDFFLQVCRHTHQLTATALNLGYSGNGYICYLINPNNVAVDFRLHQHDDLLL